jgi:hypothetical protein
MLTCITLLLLFLLYIFLDENNRNLFLKEGGLIESATNLGYFFCVALIVYQGRFAYIKRYYYIFLLIIFFMLRELDFDTRFTTTGIFKIRFFTSTTVPLLEKIVGVMLMLLLIYIIVTIIHRHLKVFLLNLKKQDTISIGVLMTCVFLAVSAFCDGLDRKLKGLGIAISHQTSLQATAVEEIVELGIPIIIFFTLSAYFRKNKFLQNTPR